MRRPRIPRPPMPACMLRGRRICPKCGAPGYGPYLERTRDRGGFHAYPRLIFIHPYLFGSQATSRTCLIRPATATSESGVDGEESRQESRKHL